MVRPRKRKLVNFKHQMRNFKPWGLEENHLEENHLEEDYLEEVVLTFDELEAIRLSFLESLSQTEAATRMDIHQSTFQRALKRALVKITEALV